MSNKAYQLTAVLSITEHEHPLEHNAPAIGFA
jgi:hypothetical protein